MRRFAHVHPILDWYFDHSPISKMSRSPHKAICARHVARSSLWQATNLVHIGSRSHSAPNHQRRLDSGGVEWLPGR